MKNKSLLFDALHKYHICHDIFPLFLSTTLYSHISFPLPLSLFPSPTLNPPKIPSIPYKLTVWHSSNQPIGAWLMCYQLRGVWCSSSTACTRLSLHRWPSPHPQCWEAEVLRVLPKLSDLSLRTSCALGGQTWPNRVLLPLGHHLGCYRCLCQRREHITKYIL